MREPLVSISCITYNHEPFIRQCLDGFLMQKCDFEYEILIHDDASTDGTQDIIKEYQDKYPEIVKPIFQIENQLSKGVRAINATFNYPRAQGKYIALCEGDDYWTDPLKLQKQVDFLNSTNDCVASAHPSKFVDALSHKFIRLNLPLHWPKNNRFQLSDIMKFANGHIHTSSIMFKSKYVIPYPLWAIEAPVGDFPLKLLLSYYGSIGYMPDVMSVRNTDVPGSWSNSMTKRKKMIRHYRGIMKMWDQFNIWTDNKYNSDIRKIQRQRKCMHYKLTLKHYIKRVIRSNRLIQ